LHTKLKLGLDSFAYHSSRPRRPIADYYSLFQIINTTAQQEQQKALERSNNTHSFSVANSMKLQKTEGM
jgi:hypothetical protein